MKRTRKIKEEFCSKCKFTDKTIELVGKVCKVQNATIEKGQCSVFRR